MKCENCKNEHDGNYGSGRFCSCKCARGFSTKTKRSLINEKVSKRLSFQPYIKICECCQQKFETKIKRRRFCCNKCSSKSNYGLKGENNIKFIYRQLCNFKFGLSSYPNEFNFELIKEYGWYTAKNRGNNINGISRDHKLSVHSGFKQRINPYLISHPANCELKKHKDNNIKNISNSITLEELIFAIKQWNKKYNNDIDFKIFLTEEEIIKMYRRSA